MNQKTLKTVLAGATLAGAILLAQTQVQAEEVTGAEAIQATTETPAAAETAAAETPAVENETAETTAAPEAGETAETGGNAVEPNAAAEAQAPATAENQPEGNANTTGENPATEAIVSAANTPAATQTLAQRFEILPKFTTMAVGTEGNLLSLTEAEQFLYTGATVVRDGLTGEISRVTPGDPVRFTGLDSVDYTWDNYTSFTYDLPSGAGTYTYNIDLTAYNALKDSNLPVDFYPITATYTFSDRSVTNAVTYYYSSQDAVELRNFEAIVRANYSRFIPATSNSQLIRTYSLGVTPGGDESQSFIYAVNYAILTETAPTATAQTPAAVTPTAATAATVASMAPVALAAPAAPAAQPAARPADPGQPAAAQLPQTGEKASASLTTVGALLLASAGFAAFSYRKGRYGN